MRPSCSWSSLRAASSQHLWSIHIRGCCQEYSGPWCQYQPECSEAPLWRSVQCQPDDRTSSPKLVLPMGDAARGGYCLLDGQNAERPAAGIPPGPQERTVPVQVRRHSVIESRGQNGGVRKTTSAKRVPEVQAGAVRISEQVAIRQEQRSVTTYICISDKAKGIMADPDAVPTVGTHKVGIEETQLGGATQQASFDAPIPVLIVHRLIHVAEATRGLSIDYRKQGASRNGFAICPKTILR